MTPHDKFCKIYGDTQYTRQDKNLKRNMRSRKHDKIAKKRNSKTNLVNNGFWKHEWNIYRGKLNKTIKDGN